MLHSLTITGHTAYIAGAFGLSTLILLFNLWWPLHQKRKLYKKFHEPTP